MRETGLDEREKSCRAKEAETARIDGEELRSKRVDRGTERDGATISIPSSEGSGVVTPAEALKQLSRVP